MGITGTAVATPAVVSTAAVEIKLQDQGEIRRLGRLLIAGAATYPNGRTGAFANDLIAALGFTESNTSKQ